MAWDWFTQPLMTDQPNPLAKLDDPPERWPDGFVYFAQLGDDGPVKIGHSLYPRQRLAQFSLPEKLHLRVVMPGTRSLEAFWHDRFADFQLRGEWYSDAELILWKAADIATTEPPEKDRAWNRTVARAIEDGRLPHDYWKLSWPEIHRRVLWNKPLREVVWVGPGPEFP